MKIATQLKYVSAITLVALLAAALICSWKLHILRLHFIENQQKQTSIAQLAQMKSNMLTLSRLDVMSPDATQQLQQAEQQIHNTHKTLSPTLTPTQQQPLQQALSQNWQRYITQFHSAIKIAETSPEDAITIPEQLYRIDLAPLIEQISQLMHQIASDAQRSEATIEQDIQQLIWGVLIPIGCAGFIIIISQLGFAKRLQTSLHKMGLIAQRLHEGEITLRMPESRDELGELSFAINRFLQQLQQVLTQASIAATATRADTQRISDLSNAVSLNTRDQSLQLDDIRHASATLSCAIAHVGTLAAQAASTAQSSSAATSNADQAGQITLKNLSALSSHFAQVESEMQTLTHSFAEIVNVSATIKDIADQTNLLALNAAIEAARAGESGRGFAVVADEVRKLAQHTTESTRNIQDILKKTQTNTRVTSHAISAASVYLGQFNDHGQTVSRSLSQIRSESEGVADMMASIAAAVDQQTAAAQAIAEQVSTISSGLNHTHNDNQAIKQEMKELADVANDLERSMATFRTENNYSCASA